MAFLEPLAASLGAESMVDKIRYLPAPIFSLYSSFIMKLRFITRAFLLESLFRLSLEYVLDQFHSPGVIWCRFWYAKLLNLCDYPYSFISQTSLQIRQEKERMQIQTSRLEEELERINVRIKKVEEEARREAAKIVPKPKVSSLGINLPQQYDSTYWNDLRKNMILGV